MTDARKTHFIHNENGQRSFLDSPHGLCLILQFLKDFYSVF